MGIRKRGGSEVISQQLQVTRIHLYSHLVTEFLLHLSLYMILVLTNCYNTHIQMKKIIKRNFVFIVNNWSGTKYNKIQFSQSSCI